MDLLNLVTDCNHRPTAIRVHKAWLDILLVSFLLCSGYLFYHIASFAEIGVFLLSLLIFMLPGLPIGIILFGKDVKANPEAIIFGAAMGISLSCLVSATIGYVIEWNATIILAGIILLLAPLSLCAIKSNSPLILLKNDNKWDISDYLILLLFFIVVILMISTPLLNVGKLTEQGYSYTWLFGFDFLLRKAIAASITHGIPVPYFHFSGEPIHLYLLSYILPAFAYSLSGRALSLQAIMLLTQVTYALLLTSVLFAFLKLFFRQRKVLLIIMLLAFCAYSFADLYVLFRWTASQISADSLPWWLRTKIADFEGYSLLKFKGVSHTFYRFFLVEPQATLGISVLLTTMAILYRASFKPFNVFTSVLLGVLMGAELGIEGTTGLVLGGWFSLVALYHLTVRHEQYGHKRLILFTTISLLTCISIYILYFVIGIYSISSASALHIKPFFTFALLAPVYLPIEHGPMFFFALMGLCICFKKQQHGNFGPVLLLGALALLVTFFLYSPGERFFGVLKGARIFPIPLLVFSGIFVEHAISKNPGESRRTLVRLIASLSIVLALPTMVTDAYITSNVKNKFTVYITRDDYEACKWIKGNTPIASIIQSEPNYPDVLINNETYQISLITAFGERRMVLGTKRLASIIQNRREEINRRFKDIKYLFGSSDPEKARSIIRKYAINYIYCGPLEKKLYPTGIKKFDADTLFFTKVYSQGNVDIYRCNLNS